MSFEESGEIHVEPIRTEDERPLSKAEIYGAKLWEQVETLYALKTPLVDRQQQLFEEVESMRSGKVPFSNDAVIAQKEEEYFRLGERIGEISGIEEQIAQSLEDVANGAIDEDKLKTLLPPEEEAQELSKRKKRIMEDNKKLGINPKEDEFSWMLYYDRFSNRFVSPETTHLTTGRNLKKAIGSFDPLLAEGEFFNRTADTHGGKVSYGKKADFYTNASGKRVRKR